MKNKGNGYPYLNIDRLTYIYKCVKCKAHIKKGIATCYRCGYEFTSSDIDKMITEYKENYSKNWHVKIYFVLFVGGIVLLLLNIN